MRRFAAIGILLLITGSAFALANRQAPAPIILSITPNQGPATGGTVLTITGHNFQDGLIVTIGGVPCIVSSVQTATDPNTITCTTSRYPGAPAQLAAGSN